MFWMLVTLVAILTSPACVVAASDVEPPVSRFTDAAAVRFSLPGDVVQVTVPLIDTSGAIRTWLQVSTIDIGELDGFLTVARMEGFDAQGVPFRYEDPNADAIYLYESFTEVVGTRVRLPGGTDLSLEHLQLARDDSGLLYANVVQGDTIDGPVRLKNLGGQDGVVLTLSLSCNCAVGCGSCGTMPNCGFPVCAQGSCSSGVFLLGVTQGSAVTNDCVLVPLAHWPLVLTALLILAVALWYVRHRRLVVQKASRS